MHLISLFIICTCVYVTSGATHPDFYYCDNSREAVVECAAVLFDTDHDGRITADEIDDALPNLVSIPVAGMDSEYFMKCDMDGDNVLTMEDWNHVNSTCLPTFNCLYAACLVCVRNGFQMTHPEPVRGPDGRVPVGTMSGYDYEGLMKYAKDNADKIRELAAKFEKDGAKARKKMEKYLAKHPQSPVHGQKHQ